MFVPQHDLQDFLRTAELLEIKGLLKDDAAWPPQGLASLFQAPVSPGPPQKQQQQQQHTVVLRYGSDKKFQNISQGNHLLIYEQTWVTEGTRDI